MNTDQLSRDELTARLRAAERALAEEKAAHAETRSKLRKLRKSQKSFSEEYFRMEMQLKAALSKVEAFRTGAKIEQLRADYRSVIRKKDAGIRRLKHAVHEAEGRIVRMRKAWGEVFDSMVRERNDHVRACEKACEVMLHKLQRGEEEITACREKAQEALSQKYQAEIERDTAIERNKALQRQLARDYENSGVPSSAQEYGKRARKKIQNNRPKSNRRRGGQPGRIGTTLRPRTGDNIKVVWLEAEDRVTSSPEWYETEQVIVKQVCDIEFRVTVTDYKTKVWRHRKTGSRYHAPFPAGVQNPANYGTRLKTLILYLTEFCSVPASKVCELISEMSGQELQVSEGFAASLCRQFEQRSKEEQREICCRIQNSPYVHIDSTVYDLEGERKCVTVCVGNNAVHYTYTDKKGHQAAMATPIGQCEFQHCLIHDDESTFFNYAQPDKHQLCLVHLIRKLKDSVQWEPERTWNHKFLTLTQTIIHLRNQTGGNLSAEQICQIQHDFDELLALGASEYEYEPPSIGYPHGQRTLNELKKRRDAVLNCLDKPWLPHQNNTAERMLRPIKRHTRAAVTNRSEIAARSYCAFLTVTKTAELECKPVFPLIADIIARPLPRSARSVATQFGADSRPDRSSDGPAA